MPVSLSIKDVPEALAERLRARASRNHRSLQRELMAIVEAAAAAPDTPLRALIASSVDAPAYEVVRSDSTADAGGSDELLSELDAIAAGSRWARAPLLTREQANDRRLGREFEFEAQQAARHEGGA